MMTRSTRTPSSSSVAREQVVGERPVRGQALELHRDRARLPRPDPDRQVAVALGLLEDDDVAAGQHVDPHALDDHLDELVVRPWPAIIPRPAGGRPVAGRRGPAGPRERRGPTATPATKPPMWAKKATPPLASASPSEAEPVDQLEHEPEARAR